MMTRSTLGVGLLSLLGCAARPAAAPPAKPAASGIAEGSPPPAVTTHEPLAPAPLPASGALREVRVGNTHACALSASGQVWCWGDNRGLAVGSTCGDVCSSPRLVSLSAPAIALGLGDDTSCALLASGAVECWGHHQARLAPIPRAAASRLVGGDPVSCHLDVHHDLACGGWNVFGRLGFPESGDEEEHPVMLPSRRVPLAASVTSAIVLLQFGCAVTSAGELYCWGTPLRCDGPHLIGLGEPVAAVEAGGACACFLTASGKVFGHPEYHERVASGCQDLPADFSSSLEKPWAEGASAVACYGSYPGDACRGCLVEQDGTAACANFDDLDSAAPAHPSRVPGLPKVEQVAVGGGFACAVARDRRVYCWGDNRYGQLGRGSETFTPQPTPAEPRWPTPGPH